jgi:hypothetical protein
VIDISCGIANVGHMLQCEKYRIIISFIIIERNPKDHVNPVCPKNDKLESIP